MRGGFIVLLTFADQYNCCGKRSAGQASAQALHGCSFVLPVIRQVHWQRELTEVGNLYDRDIQPWQGKAH